MERSQVFRDSAILYKIGIITELQIQIFIGLHESYFVGPEERMLCENGCDAPFIFICKEALAYLSKALSGSLYSHLLRRWNGISQKHGEERC